MLTMAVPEFEEFLLPTLRLLADSREHAKSQLREELIREMNMSWEDLREMVPSGQQSRFDNRFQWATVYLAKAGLIERPQRGVYQITREGQALLRRSPSRITVRDLLAYPGFQEFQSRVAGSPAPRKQKIVPDLSPPHEQLDAIVRDINESLTEEILRALKQCSPACFDRIILLVVKAMGYCGSGLGAQRNPLYIREEDSGDFWASGHGFSHPVYFEARRTRSPLGWRDVQSFALTLEKQQAQQGLLLTTETFTEDAREYAGSFRKRIVLMDGREIAKLMINRDIGVTLHRTYVVKKLTPEFFD